MGFYQIADQKRSLNPKALTPIFLLSSKQVLGLHLFQLFALDFIDLLSNKDDKNNHLNRIEAVSDHILRLSA